MNDTKAFGIDTANYADEYNVTTDWNVNRFLSFSVVGALADPNDGAKEHTGGDNTWSYVMLYGAIKFY